MKLQWLQARKHQLFPQQWRADSPLMKEMNLFYPKHLDKDNFGMNCWTYFTDNTMFMTFITKDACVLILYQCMLYCFHYYFVKSNLIEDKQKSTITLLSLHPSRQLPFNLLHVWLMHSLLHSSRQFSPKDLMHSNKKYKKPTQFMIHHTFFY